MSRSVWKVDYINMFVFDKVLRCLPGDCEKFVIKVWDRSLVILAEYVNWKVRVYNGKEFSKVVKIKEGMVGLKFGSLSLTRKYPHHKNKDKVKKKS